MAVVRSFSLWAVAVILVALGGCSEPDSPQVSPDTEALTKEPATIVITMQDDMTFDPRRVQVPKGAVVEWVNRSDVPHTTTARVGNEPLERLPEGIAGWDSGLLQNGERFRMKFDTPGEYQYVCTLHLANNMVGRIEVLPAGEQD
ncbi:hypothetical protein GCM10007160_29300 [Litchfieldella qijiaojingensis]|uniref:Blue (type 1) copper domain-containing protein n=1 Tax=Litchfieldella qijiaojingensis TaxID=980347 RepID=A0ABQ2Z1W4_9GAMM|nr:plastocyanin/azurin family copper-binding protein [Halomonas qijiaojingensis]GGX99686.1 hypothetical protein GCM10007160_29300 [Halomonas qijiaojingensis]